MGMSLWSLLSQTISHDGPDTFLVKAFEPCQVFFPVGLEGDDLFCHDIQLGVVHSEIKKTSLLLSVVQKTRNLSLFSPFRRKANNND